MELIPLVRYAREIGYRRINVTRRRGNILFCFTRHHQDFVMGDLAKLERHMVFVNNEDVNLAEYLAERRVRKPVCESCPHSVFCGGFYELEKVPEPRGASPTGTSISRCRCGDREAGVAGSAPVRQAYSR